ncbi:hypothetical protein I7I53_02311 [Histoplasma capsulatum var. duboisii H88]|uniref:Uncharacterized protein n=1 Tax=Ajellomyces capsulatus (strain H88) TaxID=544711 RepID=A0A8A1LNM2_AJEC8|nr:hypothetical protein I7I53_02311 [Histoplasma capsulatum var. duboisii H88]
MECVVVRFNHAKAEESWRNTSRATTTTTPKRTSGRRGRNPHLQSPRPQPLAQHGMYPQHNLICRPFSPRPIALAQTSLPPPYHPPSPGLRSPHPPPPTRPHRYIDLRQTPTKTAARTRTGERTRNKSLLDPLHRRPHNLARRQPLRRGMGGHSRRPARHTPPQSVVGFG